MPVTSVTTDPQSLTMTVVGEFPVPVERLWAAFADPRQLERFWGPPGYPATFERFDARPGGVATYWMTSPGGERFYGRWDFEQVDAPKQMVVRDSFADAQGEVDPSVPTGRMTLQFESTADGSRFTAISASPTLEALEQVIAMGQVEGMRQAFGHGAFAPRQINHLGFALVAFIFRRQFDQIFGIGDIVALLAVEDDILDRLTQFRIDTVIDRQVAGIDDAHIHARLDGVIEEDTVDRPAYRLIAAE